MGGLGEGTENKERGREKKGHRKCKQRVSDGHPYLVGMRTSFAGKAGMAVLDKGCAVHCTDLLLHMYTQFTNSTHVCAVEHRKTSSTVSVPNTVSMKVNDNQETTV